MNTWVKLGLVLAAFVALALLGRQAGDAIQAFATWVDGLGAWAPAVFVAGYAVAVAALVPGSLLTLAGGAVFGLGWGILYVFAGALLGSTGGFLIARYFARSWVEQRIEGNPRFAAMDRAVAESGLKITFLLRLSPAFPFSFLNYALGLTRVQLRDYLLASFGMLPGTVLYVYYGSVIGDVASLAGGARPSNLWLTAVGLAATVAVTIVVTRIARRALNEATDGALEEPAAHEA